MSSKEQEITYITPQQSPIWEKLTEYKNVLELRSQSANFALFILYAENSDWKELAAETAKNLALEAGKNGKYLDDIAQRNYTESSHKVSELKDALNGIQEVLLRINNALATLEVNSYVSEFSTAPTYSSELGFDITSEDRKIKSLLYATDALLEITQN